MDDMKKELQVIQELMDQLADKMQYGEDDLSERLGRPKPGIAVMKVEGSMPGMKDDPMMEKSEEAMGMDLDGDKEMGEDPAHAAMVMGGKPGMDDEGMDMNMDMDSPDDMLKKRLMKLRA